MFDSLNTSFIFNQGQFSIFCGWVHENIETEASQGVMFMSVAPAFSMTYLPRKTKTLLKLHSTACGISIFSTLPQFMLCFLEGYLYEFCQWQNAKDHWKRYGMTPFFLWVAFFCCRALLELRRCCLPTPPSPSSRQFNGALSRNISRLSTSELSFFILTVTLNEMNKYSTVFAARLLMNNKTAKWFREKFTANNQDVMM